MQPQFSAAFGFSEGLGRVRVDQESGYVNSSGEWVIKMSEREAVGEFSGGLALVFDRASRPLRLHRPRGQHGYRAGLCGCVGFLGGLGGGQAACGRATATAT